MILAIEQRFTKIEICRKTRARGEREKCSGFADIEQGATAGRFRNTNYPYVPDVSFGVHVRVPYIRKASSWNRSGAERFPLA